MMRTDSQATSGMVEWIDEQCCHGLDDDHHNVLAQDLADVTRMYTKKTNTSHEDVNEVAEANEAMDNTVTMKRTTGDDVDNDESKDHDRDEHLQSQTRPMETRKAETRAKMAKMVEVVVTLEKARKPLNPTVKTGL
eukprot:jgi/Phyca11/20046/fgenesh1_pg.PHYCAscaffold_55_\